MGHRGSCCDLCQRVFYLFCSRSFIVSGLTFRSVYGVRKDFPGGSVVKNPPATKIYSGEKTISLTNGAGKTGQPPVKE